ncbi:MAG: hypothetical protein AAFY11_06260 [Cyanobacteria bacterium J06641_5]
MLASSLSDLSDDESSMKTAISKLAIALGSLLVVAGPAQAAGLTLDFQTAPDGTILNPNALDGSGQVIGGETFSTSLGNIDRLFSANGVNLTATPNSSSSTLGLFNSNCTPSSGGFNSAGTAPCGTSRSNGDDDLATGIGFNPFGEQPVNGINFNSTPQGNLLIFEENRGNGTPDDSGAGGTFSFSFDRDVIQRAVLQEVVVVDDVSGSIDLFFTDSTSQTLDFEGLVENEVVTLGAGLFQQRDLVGFDVNFDGSGGLSSVVFAEFADSSSNNTGAVPEGETALGLVAAAGLFSLKQKLKKSTNA